MIHKSVRLPVWLLQPESDHMGEAKLRVPQDRQGRFRTEVFAGYQRSEKALVHAVMEMYIQGVSTARLEAFAHRRLAEEEYPYLILDTRDEKVRESGTVRSLLPALSASVISTSSTCSSASFHQAEQQVLVLRQQPPPSSSLRYSS